MKKLFMAVVFSIILSLLNQGYGQENPILIDSSSVSKIIMQNSWIRVTLSTTSGEISSFIDWHSGDSLELLTDNAFIMFIRKRNNDTIKQSEGDVINITTESMPGIVRAIFDIKFPSLSAETTYLVKIKYTLETQPLRWDAKLQRHLYPDTAWEANIDFSIPVITKMDYAFWTKDNAPFKLPITRTVRYRKLYDVWTVIPTIILYNDTTNVGLSFVSPFELRKPKLEWEMKKDSFIITNSYLRLSRAHPCSAAVYIVPHEADWRPGLAWIYDKYPGYFNPKTALQGEGWLAIVDERPNDAFLANLKERGMSWVEYFHFPFYGYYAPCAPYAPDKNSWMIITDTLQTIPYDTWKINFYDSIRRTGYDSNNVRITRWRDSLDIQTYLYFQTFESWYQFTNRFFTDEFAIGAHGETLSAWEYCYLMNPDPNTNSDWGKHIDSQIKVVLDKYPNIAGIFYDRDDYCDYDYRHDDGVTMIGPDSVYMLGFAQEKINDSILNKVHNDIHGTPGKGVWTNGPTSVEVCKDMDGIMSEALYQAPLLQYLGISRPLILLPSDITPQQTETKLKTALWTGHFPSISWYDSDTVRADSCKNIDTKYQPLFALYKDKKWVLYPHALQLPEGIKGNIFQTPAPDSDYLVAMIDPDRFSSIIYPRPETTHDIFRYDRWAKIRVPDSMGIKYCYIQSGDYKGINQDSIYRDNGLEINIPAHWVSSLIQLSKEPRYEITRTSPPVFFRGETAEVVIRIQNISHGDSADYDFKLKTPLDSLKDTFVLNSLGTREETLDIEVAGDEPLGEDTMKVLLKITRHDTTLVDTTIIFTTWIVDVITFQLQERPFIHSGKWSDSIIYSNALGDTIPFALVNNTNRELNIRLSGSLARGRGEVRFGSPPFQTTLNFDLNPLQDTLLLVYIAPDSEIDTVKIRASVNADTIYAIRPIERSMKHDPRNDLFYDDFSFGDMRKWVVKPDLGSWTVVNKTAKGDSVWHMALSPLPFQSNDYKCQVNTKLENSSHPLIDWIKSYIYFRVQNESTYYRFGLSQGFRAIRLFRRVNGVWSLLKECDFDVKKDVWYNLRAEVVGHSIKCFLDGNLVINVQDDSLSYGGIAIGVTEDAYVNYYDDVVVRRVP